MRLDKYANEILSKSYLMAEEEKYEYLTPEYVMYTALNYKNMRKLLMDLGVNIQELKLDLEKYLNENTYKSENGPINSILLDNIISKATLQKASAGKDIVTYYDIFLSMYDEEESHISYFLKKQGLKRIDILNYITSIDNEKSIDYDEDEFGEDEFDEDINYLETYATNLTELAKEKKLDPLIGREEILERTMQVLLRRTKNNPLHIGESGVGKTAITEGLAQLIAKNKVPKNLKDTNIYSIDIATILAGTKYRGDFEERLKNILLELSTEEKPIVYIDEIHTLMGAGAGTNTALDASNILKPYLTSSNIRFIGSTTFDEYKKFIEKNKAFARRFQTIVVEEPSVEDSIKILMGIKSKYEKYHNVKYTDKAIEAACTLSNKYIQDRHLPDKAIDIIDETAAFYRIKNNRKITITEEHIEKIISKLARVPKEKIEENEVDRLRTLDKELEKSIFGQEQAITEIVKAIRRSRVGFNDENKPIASFLFVGNTGVGKTELAKQLANTMQIPLVRFDMSEYQEKHSVAKLIGTPPGYVGYEEGGQLIDAIKKNPHCVLLLDEIEKAHFDIYNVLLQIMDYATLTENNGRKADFKNVILIMTSNAGASDMSKNLVGFGQKTMGETSVSKAINKVFSPEFRNRLSSIVLFNDLNKDMAILVTKKEIDKLNKKLADKKIKIELSEETFEHISNKALNTKYGAREIIRYIDKDIKDWLVEKILFNEIRENQNIYINIENDKLNFKIKK
ncbi:ATP-dependent Clp protease ATP-binding subunit ClpA [Hypnocyclicus thermotrophus]|uniref:ATP-dependent Clp protease ATP-binding subunit ClpA n=1 Tax=Hypnocyclicus thermotrophus TaxID=1627895 RepID=A0AA46DX49_9FUSO|nr:AAA family ATPase [Hypnocyclicus thermotrophus]TDT67434.1 ATP-dependent Clp protease ATP-binding subunit ClpA [Hypnocyclicus thermotrophus]